MNNIVKRISVFLLAIVLCVSALPSFSLPAIAEDASLSVQYGYDETDAEQVTVYVSLSNDGIPIMGKDGTVLASTAVTVPYFDLGLYDLSDYYRYSTEGGAGSYIGTEVIKRPTAMHLFIYLLERYYLGLDPEDCGKGTSGLFSYSEADDVLYMDGSTAYTASRAAITLSGSCTSTYYNEFWGHDENLMYYRNHVYPLMSEGWGATSDYMLLSDGDTIDLGMFTNWNFYTSGGFCCFDENQYSAKSGTPVTFSTLSAPTNDYGSDEPVKVEGLTVNIYDSDWNLVDSIEGSEGSYTYTFKTPGTYTLIGEDSNAGTEDAAYAPATAKVEVTCDHNNVTAIPATAATCTEKGLTAGKVCSDCGTVLEEQQEIPALGHDYQLTSMKEATCEEAGEKVYVCSHDSKHTYTEEITALGHDYQLTSTKEATCEEAGEKVYVCSHDSTHTYTEEIPALGHDYQLTSTKEATCTEAGEKVYVCSHDSTHTYTEEIPALGHDYQLASTKEATCTEAGEKVYVCSHDSTHTYTEEIPALGHDYQLTSTKNPTYTTPGVRILTCSHCGAKKTEEIPCLEKPALPAKTVISSVNTVANGMKVTWKKASRAEGYYIYRSKNGGSYSKIGTVTKGSTLQFTDKNAKTNGAKYSYKVIAYRTVNGLKWKGTTSAAFTGYYLSTPVISNVKSAAKKTATLKWKKNTKASGYEISYALTASFKNAVTVKVKSRATVQKKLTKLKSGRKYYIRIRTYKTVGSKKYVSCYSSKKTVKVK